MPLLAAPINFRPQRLAPIWMTGRRLARCCSGISSVEFALVLPVLMLFVFGVISASSALYVQNNMESAAREAARRIAAVEAPYIVRCACANSRRS